MQEQESHFYGKKLKLLRVSQLILQKEMAIKLKITQQAYSDLENGKTNFSLQRIEKICKFFKVPVAEFITITTPKNKKSKSTDKYNVKVLKQY